MQNLWYLETPAGQQVLYPTALPGAITPYLGLRARLTQAPINRWTVLLFLVLARMVILFGTLNVNLEDANVDALSACNKVSKILLVVMVTSWPKQSVR